MGQELPQDFDRFRLVRNLLHPIGGRPVARIFEVQLPSREIQRNTKRVMIPIELFTVGDHEVMHRRKSKQLIFDPFFFQPINHADHGANGYSIRREQVGVECMNSQPALSLRNHRVFLAERYQ